MINILQTERETVPRYVKQTLVQHQQQGSLPGVYFQVLQDSHSITSCVVFMHFSLLFIAPCWLQHDHHALIWWKIKNRSYTNKPHRYSNCASSRSIWEDLANRADWRCALLHWPLPLSVHGLTSRSLGIFMCSHYLLIKVVRMLYCRGKVLNIKWKLHLKYQGTSKKQVTNHF